MSRFARAHATRAAQVRASRACRMARRLPGQRTVNGRSLAAALLVALTGCAGAGSSGGSLPAGTGTAGVTGPGSGTAGSGLGPGTAGSGGGAGGTGGSPLPPEMELESSYEIPVATGHFIWTANPQSGRVAYVDATTLEVHTVEAGNAPTYIAAIPGADDAVIVLNVLSDDATVLRITAAGLSTATIRGVAHGANALAVSADGRWAIAWTDAHRVANAPATEGYQDLTVIDLHADPQSAIAKTIVAAGFRPVSIAFAADGTRAFAVT